MPGGEYATVEDWDSFYEQGVDAAGAGVEWGSSAQVCAAGIQNAPKHPENIYNVIYPQAKG